MLQTKACPRCTGDLYQENDLYGTYISCLNCGQLEDVNNDLRRPEKPTDYIEEASTPRVA
jgi:hypothetical protein